MPGTLTGDPTVDRLLAKRTELCDRAASIKASAAATERELSDDELKIIDDVNKALPDIDRQLETVTIEHEMSDEVRDRISRVSGAVRPSAGPYQSVGHLVWDAVHQDSDEDARIRYRSAVDRAATRNGRVEINQPLERSNTMFDRAAEHMGTIAADTVATAGDLAAVTVIPKVGPVINPYPARMPFAVALGLTTATAGHFTRPFIVDADFDAGVAAQSAQKAELASEMFTTDDDIVKLTTYGGYLNVSQQLLTWTPGALGIIVDQMNRRRSSKIEAALVAELSASTGETALAADADAAEMITAIWQAAAAVGSSTDEPPTMIVMGWDGWARLGGLADAAGRPLMPFAGGGVFGTGLRPVVTPKITDDSFWVLNDLSIEAWVYYYGVLEAVEPSVLGRQVAVAADFKALRPTPYANTAQHLTPAG
jgi:hypothetical protein